jgi:anti-sigma B factor antagonist
MSVDEFGVETVRSERHVVVAVRGELDAFTAPRLTSVLNELWDDGVERAVLDLRRLQFVDSMGLGVFVSAKRRLSQQGNSMCIVIDPAQTAVLRIFTITGLDKVMPVHPTVQEAVDDCLRETAA